MKTIIIDKAVSAKPAVQVAKPTTAKNKRKPTTVDILHELRKFQWDFSFLKRG
jgi:hypothetical protein